MLDDTIKQALIDMTAAVATRTAEERLDLEAKRDLEDQERREQYEQEHQQRLADRARQETSGPPLWSGGDPRWGDAA